MVIICQTRIICGLNRNRKIRQKMPPCISPARERKDSKESTIHDHVYKNDIDSVKAVVNNNKECLKYKNSKGQTALIVASSFNRFEIIKELVKSGCDVNMADHEGNTALHEAADKGYIEIVRKLVETTRCDLEIKNKKGETALMISAFYDYADIAQVLLKEGSANPNVTDDNGQSALLIGLTEGSQMTVDVLLKNDCDVTIIDNLGHSALYLAVHSPCNKTLDLAKKLIASGYDTLVDKMWLMNEEKHNMFYQDDEFYAKLRKTLREFDANNNHISIKTDNLNVAHTPFAISPSLRLKIKSPDVPKFGKTPLQFTKQSLFDTVSNGTTPSLKWSSRRNSERTMGAWTKPVLTSSFSSDSDMDMESPFGSPGSSNTPLLSGKCAVPAFKWSTKSAPISETSSVSSMESKSDLKSSPISQEETDKLAALPSRTGKESTPSSTTVTVSRSKSSATSKSPLLPILKTRSSSTSSAPRKAAITYKRQISVQVPEDKHLNKGDTTRKIKIPAKPTVHFSTEIQVVEIKRKR